jgi:hypothetical protein
MSGLEKTFIVGIILLTVVVGVILMMPDVSG